MRVGWLLLPMVLAQEPDAGPLRLPCIADTSICLHEAERDLNQGGKSHLRLKGIQHFLLLDFDWEPLAGRGVRRARLVLTPSGPVSLKTLGLSTVASRWAEGSGIDAPARPGECSARSPAVPATWAGAGTDVLDATFTAGGAIAFYRDVTTLPDGQLAVDVPPAVVHACVCGESFGLAVSDEKGQTMANSDVRSREDRAGAVLEVEPADGPAPRSGAERPAARAIASVRHRALPAAPGAVFDAAPAVAGARWLAPAWAPCGPSRSGATVIVVTPRGGSVVLACVGEGPMGVPEGEIAGLPPPRVFRLLALGDGPGRDPLAPATVGPVEGRTTFVLEWDVGPEAEPGARAGRVRTGHDVLPFTLRVSPSVLARAPTFQCSLNTYGSPGGALGDAEGSPEFVRLERDAYRLAHAHRCTLTPLPYSQSGQVEASHVPVRRDDGVWDWSAYDARIGPLLDGSAFADLPRGAVPLDHVYLPLHENWPLPIAAHYAYRGTVADHWRDAPPIEAAFPEAYAARWREATTAFVTHARARGFTRTRFLAYLNNKVLYRERGRGTSWWLLDEPAYRDDFLALAWFGRLFRDGVAAAGPGPGQFLFRIDLSRPEWRRDHLDGLVGLVVTNRWGDRGATIRETARAFGEAGWSYGEAPAPDRAAVETWAWCLRAALAGADGLVPWDSIGRQESWAQPEGTALILPARPGMALGWYPTLRLKALRAATEAAELVQQVESRLGWTRAEIAAALDRAGILPTDGPTPPDAPERTIAALCALLDG